MCVTVFFVANLITVAVSSSAVAMSLSKLASVFFYRISYFITEAFSRTSAEATTYSLYIFIVSIFVLQFTFICSKCHIF